MKRVTVNAPKGAVIKPYNGSTESVIGESVDMVNAPPHYKSHPSGVECIQVTRHMNFNLGNATKYIWRAGLKGNAVEDLKKAAFYINDEIKRLENE